MGAQHFWNTCINGSHLRTEKLTEITIWGYFVSDTTIRIFDAFQCFQSENNYQKPVWKTFRLTLHNHCTLLIENRRFQIVMDPSREPVNNFQAFLGMYPIDKILVMVSVRDFCLFVFHCWFISFSNWDFWKIFGHVKFKFWIINMPFVRIFVVGKRMT